jgi:hypothetical protein
MQEQVMMVPVPVPADPVVQFLPRDMWAWERDYFAYSVDYNTLAASAINVPQQINIQNDSDFLCLEISRIITTDAAGGTEQSFAEQTIQIQDTGSGAFWFDSFQHLDNVAGRMTVDGRGPHKLLQPRWVKGGSALTVFLTNLEANARRIWITFHGVKIFRGKRR